MCRYILRFIPQKVNDFVTIVLVLFSNDFEDEMLHHHEKSNDSNKT